MTTKTRDKLMADILDVMSDGNRIDRFLEMGSDGLFLTTKNQSSQQVMVPWLDAEDHKVAAELIANALKVLVC